MKGIEDLTNNANRIASNGSRNGYRERNAIVISEAKQRIRYNNGFTAKHYSVEALLADAERDVRHSNTLERNITKAWGNAKPIGAAAHHIVASREPLAEGSREKLARWGIGINDGDNGVYLPNSRMAEIPGHPNALRHRCVHTERYYINVYARLRLASDQESGRLRLRAIKAEMLAGAFPY